MTSVESGIRDGLLAPGEPLPTVRRLAGSLGVSPATVARAYMELRQRGLVLGEGRRGTRVTRRPPVSTRLPLVVPAGRRDLAGGGPDPDLLPPLPPIPRVSRGYGEEPVTPHLAAAARRQLSADGIDATNLAAVGGALDGVERVLSAWLRPGDRIAVEDPAYAATLDLLGAMSIVPVPVATDERGVLPDSLGSALAGGVEAVLLTPRAQNPTGGAWDDQRAGDLRRVLAAHPDALVVEDDHAGPVAGSPAYTVCSTRRRWATIRSVAKSLGPDLRLAVLVGDAATVSRVQGRQSLGTGWVSALLQGIVADLWADSATGRLLRRATATYAERRASLVAAMGAQGVNMTAPSGLTAWIAVADEPGVVMALLESGWAVTPGEHFRIASPPGIRIALATLQPLEAAALAADLAACLQRRPVRLG